MPKPAFRLPRILLTEGVAAPRGGPYISPSAGNTGAAALGAAITDVSKQFMEHAQRIDDEQGKDEAARLTAGVPARLETLREQVQQPFDADSNPHGYPQGETPSQSLPERFNKAAGQIHTEVTQAVTTRRAPFYLKDYFQRVLPAADARATADKFRLFRSEQADQVAGALTDYTTAGIAAKDEDVLGITLHQADQYLDSKSGGVIDPAKVGDLKRKFREDVYWGRGVRAIDDDPEQDLAPLLRNLSPADALKLQDHARVVKQRKAVEMRDSQHALDRAMKGHGESVERYMVNSLDAGTLTQATISDYQEYLTSEKVAAYRQAVHDRELGGGPGNPDLVRQFKAAVYSPELTSSAQAEAIGRQLYAAFNAKQVPEKEFTAMQSHLQSFAKGERERAEARADKRQGEQERIADTAYADAKDAIRSALRSTKGEMAEFDVVSEEAQTQALEDLSRSTGRGRLTNAADWWEQNRARYVARVQSRAAQRTEQLRQGMTGRVPELLMGEPTQTTANGIEITPQYDRALRKLKAAESTYPNRRDWLEDVKRAEELWRLSRESRRLEILKNLKPTPTTTGAK